MALAAGGALARLLLTLMGDASVFGAAAPRLRLMVVVLGSATILVGELAAFREEHLKRMLGFSSIAQMGMVAAGIALASEDTVRGALLLLANHAAVKAMLFVIAGSFIGTAGSGSWRLMAGLGRSRPLAGALFAAGALALIGLPPFAGFWGKLGLLRGAFALGAWGYVAAVAVLLATVLEGVYTLRVAHRLFEPAGAGKDVEARPRAAIGRRATLLAPALVLAAAVVAVGVAPRLLEPWLASAAAELLDPAGYAALILGRTP
jgi:formate hydrogenlyase subunit 3/multisubunit Na+/H+ antiporter MnhD subunit